MMIASRAAAGQASPQVTVYSKVPGGPWFVGLGGSGGPEVELGPYENSASAKSDAVKLRQFFASMVSDPGDTNIRAREFEVPAENQLPQGGLRKWNVRKEKA